ncbi:hypothetical protein AOZ06_04925 [Kibdelosporangium phytohabitans]|uniref:Uncharacterized protein n=1 Tax=Kibdelosporangium phytohabitans TaxID=860235 RepID=A0A0N9HW87_9PSEU|nr:hypothetical protein AOZ06_04925 [Kibdelosporangium phytohabitans]
MLRSDRLLGLYEPMSLTDTYMFGSTDVRLVKIGHASDRTDASSQSSPIALFAYRSCGGTRTAASTSKQPFTASSSTTASTTSGSTSAMRTP